MNLQRTKGATVYSHSFLAQLWDEMQFRPACFLSGTNKQTHVLHTLILIYFNRCKGLKFTNYDTQQVCPGHWKIFWVKLLCNFNFCSQDNKVINKLL